MKTQLHSPLSGLTIPLSEVPDEAFAKGLLGPGIGIEPLDSKVLAPCDGVVSFVHPSSHALNLTLASGEQILIHVGIDTVKLRGEGFTSHVTKGARVSKGQLLIEFDADLVAQKAKSLISVILMTEPSTTPLESTPLSKVTAGQDLIFSFSSTQSTSASPQAAHSTKTESKTLIVKLANGLHARPAGHLSAWARKFSGEVEIVLTSTGQSANAKSLTALLELGVRFQDEVKFRTQGADAELAAQSLLQFLSELREEESFESKGPASAVVVQNAQPLTHPGAFPGFALSPGQAFGQVAQVRPKEFLIQKNSSRSPAEELTRLRKAIEGARSELQSLLGTSAIFAAHAEILEDPELIAECEEAIQKKQSAESAWFSLLSSKAERLAKSKQALLAERAADLRDVRDRVLGKMGLTPITAPLASYPATVLIGAHLTPSDTVALKPENLVGICTTAGGATSHVAILAKSMGIPALGAAPSGCLDLPDGTWVVFDADKGILLTQFSDDQKQSALQKQKERQHRQLLDAQDRLKRATTVDGHTIDVHANVGSLKEAELAHAQGADGIGLLRTEFLFLDRATAPSETEQLEVYEKIVNLFADKPVVIRTLDVGGDKPLPYLPLPHEENPFLGIRGIRVGLRHENILREQIRAVLRVKRQGPLHLMFPMISTLTEWRKVKAITEEERLRLGAEPLSLGIMMEVPSVAVMAEAFAKEVDFFSVGTNDLTQYTLAMDRGNSALAAEADNLHPSILKMIDLTVRAAKAQGKWVGICGAIASDPLAVPFLVGLGVHELSAGPMAVARIKSAVRSISEDKATSLASQAMSTDSGVSVRNLLSYPSAEVSL